ncbi:tryptophan synthase beta chain 1-like protein [Tanacetum coccineum]
MPDVLVASVGSGCNALGLFHEFIDDKRVRMIGVEGGGVGSNTSELHSASLVRGEVGVYHGAMCYLLQDKEGQITKTESVASGRVLFPGVSPELSFLKDTSRVECHTVTDQEALDAYKRLCRLEGIVPALETSHAFAYLEKLCPTLPHGTKVVVLRHSVPKAVEETKYARLMSESRPYELSLGGNWCGQNNYLKAITIFIDKIPFNEKPRKPARSIYQDDKVTEMFSLTYELSYYRMRAGTSASPYDFKFMETCEEPTLMELYEVTCKAKDDLWINPPDKTNKRKADDKENDEHVTGRTEWFFYKPITKKRTMLNSQVLLLPKAWA